jgi:Ser/Thr protein kinase RdoA (MazF antagonist)
MTIHDLSAGGDVLDRVMATAREALRAYDIDGDVELLNVSENATFLAPGPSVIRVHRLGYHTEREIESELCWMNALRIEAGVRTPRVLRAADGRQVVTVPEGGVRRHCVRFEFLPGGEPVMSGAGALGAGALGAESHFEALGEITAQMHEHSKRWSPPAWFTRFHWDYEAAFGASPRWGRWQDGVGVGRAEREVLGRLDAALAIRLRQYGTSRERYGLVHADTRLANLLVHDGDVSVIDFDDSGFSWFMYDLATAVSFFEHEPSVPGLIHSWLAGYRRVAPVSAADEKEIWTFILYRRLLLVAWIGSHQAASTASELGTEYTQASCDLAEWYLTGKGR